METSQMIAIRNRIIGVLIERARRRLGKSIEVCAALLECSPDEFRRFELGQDGVSLPQLEVLSLFFNVPANHLWDDEVVQGQEAIPSGSTQSEAMSLRGKMLATRFHQCRRALGLSKQDLGLLIGQPADVIAHYERSERPIPVAELEIVAVRCGLSLTELAEDPSISTEPTDQDTLDLARLSGLPPDLREFVLDPGSAVYLRIAQTLGALEPQDLRQIAETILSTQD